jgi:hypothetical protein
MDRLLPTELKSQKWRRTIFPRSAESGTGSELNQYSPDNSYERLARGGISAIVIPCYLLVLSSLENIEKGA